METSTWVHGIIAAAILALVSGCAQLPGIVGTPSTTTPTEAEVPEPEPLYEWNGDGRRISLITIDTDLQQAEFYDGDERIGWAKVATGINHWATPHGRFSITEKLVEKSSGSYGNIYDDQGRLKIVNAKRGVHRVPSGGFFEGAEMPYWMRLTSSGVGIHGGHIPDPGIPASHGCIRLPETLAPIVYEHARVGTPVRIFGS